MDPQPPRGQQRPLRKKKSSRADTLTLSISPEHARQTSRSITSPAKPSPAIRSTHSSIVSSDLPYRSTSTLAHHRNISGVSPDLFSPNIAASFKSVDHGSVRSERPEPRAESAETVRGPVILERGATPPLTPFPPWVSEDEDEERCNRQWQGTVEIHDSRAGNKRQSLDCGHIPLVVMRVEASRIISSAIHGFVLALQSVIALAVFGALIMASPTRSLDTRKSPNSDYRLWRFAEPSLAAVILLCSGTLLAHEAKGLSTVALLYLQSLIMAVTTGASLILWARCLQEQSRAAKSVLMGCDVLMWGLALFGFIRAVVVWKVETIEQGADVERGATYGTFVPWNTGGERRESL
ncbi:hypothetical protein FZEAL_775 [Fusarium zealandicum]|uniref:Uncharacterized protein n=1 Tax=Fusarium zealandicum TaxID=1053134 RepID=A0A8H4UUH2_9HYPO|nr:hypothetical protein FZEAL_775 [Fusarium zealandicum]